MAAKVKLGRSRYVPETLIAALTELEAAYKEIVADPSFKVGLLNYALAFCCCYAVGRGRAEPCRVQA